MNSGPDSNAGARRLLCIVSALAGIAGVFMIGTSFAINAGPPPGAPLSVIASYGLDHRLNIVWGAWLQAVGPWLIVSFALAIVHLSGAATRLSGWLTLLGGALLLMVSLSEVTIYLSALAPSPSEMAQISANLGHGIQHLYFFVAAPSLFLPLGLVVLGSNVLPRFLGWLAIVLGTTFLILGVASMQDVVLPDAITAFAAVQSIWWLIAGVVMLLRSEAIANDLQSSNR